MFSLFSFVSDQNFDVLQSCVAIFGVLVGRSCAGVNRSIWLFSTTLVLMLALAPVPVPRSIEFLLPPPKWARAVVLEGGA